MKNRKLRKVMSFALASAMALSLAACGDSQDSSGNRGNNPGNGAEAKEFVYVPEFQEIGEENVSYYNMKYLGDALYYESYFWDEETEVSSESIVKYSLGDGTSSSVMLGEDMSLSAFEVASDGSYYAVCHDYSGEPGPDGWAEPKRMLCRYDADGTQMFAQDMTDILNTHSPDYSYIRNMALDSQDNVYLFTESKVLLFDTEGAFWGAVDTGEDWIDNTGRGGDGKVYFCYYDRSTDDWDYVLAQVDYDKKAIGATYKGFMSGNSNGSLCPGVDCDFLVSDGQAVYAYDMEKQACGKLFDWLDSDINGSYASCLGQLEDGRILASINDWENNDNGIALLTKTNASEVPRRETILIGAMYSDSTLQSAAVKFNKTSDKYRISIKTYVDYSNWTENSWSDALTSLNNDITSNNCPDIIDLNGLNVQKLAAKGVFEDLNSYLERSSVFSRDDFVDNVLEAYTYDGVLTGIPRTFYLQTVIGSASDLGDRAGWTIDEMIAYADAHPGAQLFDYSQKANILDLCMMFNESAFINWSTGECKFDTPEFKSVLEFVNRFPDEWQYEEGGASTPTRIQNGEILLDRAYLSNFNEMQLYLEMFKGEVTCIGYPTTDGGSGTGLMASQVYAITTKSGSKEGAWEFIESFLTPKEDDERGRGWWDFPSNKKLLQAMAEKAVEVEYVTDENGELVKDENGDPLPIGGGGGVGYQDGWSYTYRIPTQEEVDIILGLIDSARPVSRSNEEILKIITEEAEAFFAGQKSVDEVTNIIQSRINIYVSENS